MRTRNAHGRVDFGVFAPCSARECRRYDACISRALDGHEADRGRGSPHRLSLLRSGLRLVRERRGRSRDQGARRQGASLEPRRSLHEGGRAAGHRGERGAAGASARARARRRRVQRDERRERDRARRRRAAPDRARARPRLDRVLYLRPARDRGLLRRRRSSPKGFLGTDNLDYQLAAVHVERGRRLPGALGADGSARQLRRHRPGRGLPDARCEHRRLPSDPVQPHREASRRAARGRARDRGGPPAD